MKKLYMFDLDGTIANSMDYWATYSTEYLIKQGKIPASDFNQRAWYLSYDEVNKCIREEYGIRKTYEEVKKETEDLMKEHYLNDVEIIDGTIELFKKLKRRGHDVVIVSNTPLRVMKPFIEKYNLKDYVDDIYSASDFGLSKKDSEAYSRVLKDRNVLSANSYLIDDTLTYLLEAKKVNIKTIAVYEPHSKKSIEEVKEKTDYYLISLKKWDELNLD